MTVRILPDDLINQIAAGEVVERPASVVKELVENALDAGASQIVIDVVDGGRTLISVVDDGKGMGQDDLSKSIMRHATSKLPSDDLLSINFMGFRGEALPSIASVSDMTIDTNNGTGGLQLDCNTGEIKPSSWESGTRIQVRNLFAKVPARLKFLRTDKGEMMAVVDVIKRLALARPDVGFTLNNKWRYPKDQPLHERIIAIMGDDADGRMLSIGDKNKESEINLYGFVSEPTLRRASSIDQFLFVNGRPVKDKVLVGALRASYMDVMSTREFPLCALYLSVSSNAVDVNVSPAKTEVHFLEPARIRAFMIKRIREVLATTVAESIVHSPQSIVSKDQAKSQDFNFGNNVFMVQEPVRKFDFGNAPTQEFVKQQAANEFYPVPKGAGEPLGRVLGQIGNKYILAENENGLVVVDQHAAHERIVYERMRGGEIKTQPLLSPHVIKLKPEFILALENIGPELEKSGIKIGQFGDNAIAIYEAPADYDFDFEKLFNDIAAEISTGGVSTKLSEKIHLKIANRACHHSVRAGQKLDMVQMDALLRDIENTERGGQCNHGRPVYKIIPISEIDKWFERL
ncbi:MAG: DNA mismatch repair endonuclease MutL [Alphaproteobacteria bacterium]|nr:DNA mismatch repair endonuclease MutL [Alphaproteobacteria bacterium]